MAVGHADTWQAWLNRARAEGRPGDLLVLADEAPTPASRADAWMVAAETMRRGGRTRFALELLDRVLAAEAGHAGALHELALCRQATGTARANVGVPRQVLLFSGHMTDMPGRSAPRFPSGKIPQAERRIADVLERLGAGPADLALTQGACGGDLLFTETCQRRGVPVAWLQPLKEADFLTASVGCGDGDWLPRYRAAKALLAEPARTAPESLGPSPPGRGAYYPYERCNRWLLYTALAYGPEKLALVCLWDGTDGDGGGTAHMVDEVKRRAGHVEWIDTRSL